MCDCLNSICKAHAHPCTTECCFSPVLYVLLSRSAKHLKPGESYTDKKQVSSLTLQQLTLTGHHGYSLQHTFNALFLEEVNCKNLWFICPIVSAGLILSQQAVRMTSDFVPGHRQAQSLLEPVVLFAQHLAFWKHKSWKQTYYAKLSAFQLLRS